MNVFVFFIFASLSASATLDKSGHLMFVEYSINEPTKDEGVIYSILPMDATEPPSSGILTF